jgi:hypothetical protein
MKQILLLAGLLNKIGNEKWVYDRIKKKKFAPFVTFTIDENNIKKFYHLFS